MLPRLLLSDDTVTVLVELTKPALVLVACSPAHPPLNGGEAQVLARRTGATDKAAELGSAGVSAAGP